MTDLSQVQARVGREDRTLRNRRGILPERRNVEAPRREYNADLRNARRGDVGGADQLRQIFGLTGDAAKDFQNYANARFEREEADNAAQGAADQLAGKVDEERMAKSRAYSDAVATGRAQRAWYDFLQEKEPELRELLENQKQLTMEEREAEVNEWFETTFSDFIKDPETGDVRNFGSPRAYTWLAERVSSTRAEMQMKAGSRIEERFQEESLDNFGATVRGAITSGRGLTTETLSEALEGLPDGISAERVGARFESALKTAAVELERSNRGAEAIALIDQALGIASGVDPANPGSVRPIERIALPSAAPAAPAGAPKADRQPITTFDRAAVKAAIARPESNGNDNATNQMGSSASGRYQFTRPTFLDTYMKVYGVSRTEAGRAWANKRFDPQVQERLMDRLLDDNAEVLRKEGIDLTTANLYVAHFAGAKRAARLLKADQGAPVSRFFNSDEIAKNPTYLGGGKTVGQALAAISKAVGGQAGGVTGTDGPLGMSDPIGTNPGFRAPGEPLDPVEQAESGMSPTMVASLDGLVNLDEEQRLNLFEFRNGLASRIRSDWNRERTERQAETAWSMQLRLYGRGEPLTVAEIDAAAEADMISPQHQMALLDQVRENANREYTYDQRVEAEADEAEAQAREDQVEAITSRYTGGVLSGKMTPGQARQRLLTEAMSIRDPVVRSAVMSSVDSGLNSIENLRKDNPAARAKLDEFDDLEVMLSSNLRLVPASRRAEAQTVLTTELNKSRARFAQAIIDGKDPAAAASAEVSRIHSRMSGFYPQQKK